MAETNQENEKELLQTIPAITLNDDDAFKLMQRKAKALCASTLVPKEYQGEANVPNCMIALEMANRIGASPLMVMQNLYIVHGKPGWSSTFMISAINASKKFSPLRFDVKGEGLQKSCTAWAYDVATGDRIDGVPVTMEMAEKEGWVKKTGSKWQTMPELMFRYRAAAFFVRLYAPEILMGMHTVDEIEDISAPKDAVIYFEDLNELYIGKGELLSEVDNTFAKRIIENKETVSYKKLWDKLNSL